MSGLQRVAIFSSPSGIARRSRARNQHTTTSCLPSVFVTCGVKGAANQAEAVRLEELAAQLATTKGNTASAQAEAARALKEATANQAQAEALRLHMKVRTAGPQLSTAGNSLGRLARVWSRHVEALQADV